MQQFLIPQGRIVWGHPGTLLPKKDNQKKAIIGKDGQPVMQCAFGVAIERNYFYQYVLPALQAESRTAFPNGTPPKFAWKYKDGDSEIDDKGKPYNLREGWAGHVVLTVATQSFTPQIFKKNPVNGAWDQIGEKEIKCGDYVAVNVTVKYNGATGTNTPGLYVNPNGVIFLGYGPEIVSGGQDPDEMFAGFNPSLPAGASATPIFTGGAVPAAMNPAQPVPYNPNQPAGAPPAYNASAPVYNQPPVNNGYPPQAAQPLPAPAHDVVNNAMYGNPNPAPAYTAPAPQPTYNAPPPVNNAYPPQGAQPVYNQAPQQPQYAANQYPAGSLPAGR
jgi:hypothetical protein